MVDLKSCSPSPFDEAARPVASMVKQTSTASDCPNERLIASLKSIRKDGAKPLRSGSDRRKNTARLNEGLTLPQGEVVWKERYEKWIYYRRVFKGHRPVGQSAA